MDVRQAHVEDIVALRTRILRPAFRAGQLATYPADADPKTRHFGIFDGHHNMACATIQHEPAPWAPDQPALRLRGMAVDPTYHRQGLGERILNFAMTEVSLAFSEVSLFWCNAREVAYPFYEHMGFDYWGEPFELPKIGPHMVMWRRLPKIMA